MVKRRLKMEIDDYFPSFYKQWVFDCCCPRMYRKQSHMISLLFPSVDPAQVEIDVFMLYLVTLSPRLFKYTYYYWCILHVVSDVQFSFSTLGYNPHKFMRVAMRKWTCILMKDNQIGKICCVDLKPSIESDERCSYWLEMLQHTQYITSTTTLICIKGIHWSCND